MCVDVLAVDVCGVDGVRARCVCVNLHLKPASEL